MVGLGILIGLLLSPPVLFPWPLNFLGILPLAGGMLLLKRCFDLFGRSNTSPDTESVPKALITQGPYRWVRNPIYMGFGLIQGGLALLLASIPLLAYCQSICSWSMLGSSFEKREYWKNDSARSIVRIERLFRDGYQ